MFPELKTTLNFERYRALRQQFENPNSSLPDSIAELVSIPPDQQQSILAESINSFQEERIDVVVQEIKERVEVHPQRFIAIAAEAGEILGQQSEDYSIVLQSIRENLQKSDERIIELSDKNQELELKLESLSLKLNNSTKIVIAGGITLSLVFLGYKFIDSNSLLSNSSSKLLKEEIIENVSKYGFSLNKGFSVTKIVKKSCSYE